MDAADAGDTVLVTNGVYATGGGVTPGYSSSNRIVITKNILVSSVNGPTVTIIHGQGPLGNAGVRCVYMSAGLLSDFTLTNGFTCSGGDYGYDQSGGGVNMYAGKAVVSNCTISGNTANWNGGGSHEGMVQACSITGNSAVYGGGTCYTMVHNSEISGNNAGPYGGGMYEGTVSNSTISGNTAGEYGGGTFYTTVNNCMISGNSAGEAGGGSYGGTLNNCTISSNSARDYGGGSMYGTVNNGTISANTASGGGGTSYIALNNCTINGNTAYNGGGLHFSTANNCTISRNSAYNDGGIYDSTANNCTINGNSAYYGGATYYGAANNGLVVSNTANSGGGACNCTLGILGGRVDMGAYEWFATNDAIAPPTVISPFNVPAGGSGIVVVTNWPGVTLCGEKMPGTLVVASWLTNGVAQMLDGTQWTNHYVSLEMSELGATNMFMFRCLSNDFMTYSAATTALVIINQQMLPFVDITNENASVLYETTTMTIAGTNNAFAVGGLWWCNLLTAASGAAQVSNIEFQVSDIALAVGVNTIRVSGTNTLGETGSDSVTITRLSEAIPPVIEPDALVFPGTNESVLDAGMLTAIVWRVSRIWDNLDGTNLLLPSIAILATNSGEEFVQAGTNVPNLHGALNWAPWGLESETTAYVVRIEAVDSSGNWTNRVFTDNVFTIVPETAVWSAAFVALWLFCAKRG